MIRPVPVYSGLTAASLVTLEAMALPKKSPTPLMPDPIFTFPAVHCMAPAWTVKPLFFSSISTWRLRMFISAAK